MMQQAVAAGDWGRAPQPAPAPAAWRWPPYEFPAWVRVVVWLLLAANSLYRFYEPSTGGTGTALALLPTCPLPADDSPMCYEWERPSMVSPGSGSADSGWRSDDGAMATRECFYSNVRDATRICFSHGNMPEWERLAVMARLGSGSADSGWGDHNKASMACFYGLVRDATMECFGWSYDGIRKAAGHADDEPHTT